MARTLQESLLPAALPEMPGFETAARYRAAGEGNEGGGDFYDVFATGPARWALVIGDVCGKGPEAAALTALVRYTLRAIAPSRRRPSELLAELNEAILRQRSDGCFCTVAFGVIAPTPSGACLDVASGGHPLPLVVRAEDGAVAPVGAPGTLLGVVPDPELEDVRVELGAGDTVVLYTDGVTEARTADGFFGVEGLTEVLSDCAGCSPGEVAERVDAAVLASANSDVADDLAILAVSSAQP